MNQLLEISSISEVELHRVVTTSPQKDIKDEDRKLGVRKRFANQRRSMAVQDDLNGMRVVVIDDLYGSGGSMKEAARALRVAGAAEVLGLCITKQRLYEGVSLATQD